jgi:perosamine synthetase
LNAVREVVASGYWAGGPRVRELEKILEVALRRRHATAVGSGFGGLRLALLALGVGPGDEVLVPAYSCVALANAALSIGSRPVPVDVLPEAWNIDPERAAAACSSRTRAIIAVHTFGVPVDVASLRVLGIPVVEDCAHALGGTDGSVHFGSLGDAAVCSFYATKLVGGGEGGAVLTDRDEVARRVREWRDYSDRAPSAMRMNDRMNDLEAALAAVQLGRLGEMVEARRLRALRYDEALRPLAETYGTFRVPAPRADRIWYRYAIELVSDEADAIAARLREHGVGADLPVYSWLSEAERATAPVTARAHRRLLSLPLYPTLTDEEQARVCAAVRNILRTKAA